MVSKASGTITALRSASRPASRPPTAQSGAVRRPMPMPAARAAEISWFRFMVARTKMTEISREIGISRERFRTRPSNRKTMMVPQPAPRSRNSGMRLYPSDSSMMPTKLSKAKAKTLAHSARI